MVGSESSSATQGSSTFSVAGRKRAPTKQCANALEGNPDSTVSARAAAARMRIGSFFIAVLHCRPKGAAKHRIKGIDQAINGGARLRPARARKVNAG